MFSALEIADFFIKRDEDGISNLKLQKLLYYAQGCFLASFDRPLFKEDIRAWMHGPVVEDVYHHYKKFGSAPIPPENEDPTCFITSMSKEEQGLLEDVHDIYGGYTAWKLRDMSHEDSTWKNRYMTSGIISHSEIKDLFLDRVER
jgi:uncharacterized phage-associated protein